MNQSKIFRLQIFLMVRNQKLILAAPQVQSQVAQVRQTQTQGKYLGKFFLMTKKCKFNFSAAPSSDGSLLKNQWPSQSELQTQIEEKSKEIERLRENLGSAEAKLEHVENRIADIVGVSKTGLDGLREELQGMKSKVYTDQGDVLVMLSEMTKYV